VTLLKRFWRENQKSHAEAQTLSRVRQSSPATALHWYSLGAWLPHFRLSLVNGKKMGNITRIFLEKWRQVGF
jgi:hypothetical protein